MNTCEELLPEEPRRVSTSPRMVATLGPDPEHFLVEELPLYEPGGTGEHHYAFLEKQGLSTPELVRYIARAASVRERDIGYAGLKDKHAVTRQWLSLPSTALQPELWELPGNIRLLRASRHTNKLRTGHLRGNRFQLTLTGAGADDLSRAENLIEPLKQTGLLNYFGEQRFGAQGRNIVEALAWLHRSTQRNHKKARFYEKLYPSVLQAEVFNRYLSLRLCHGLDQLLQGEVVRLAGSGSVFVVQDPAQEQPRLKQADIVLTGPIFGPRAVAAEELAAKLESEALAALSLGEPELTRLGKTARGTRRDLCISLEDLKVEASSDTSLRLTFSLPAGSYATQLLRELIDVPWLGLR